MHLPPDIILMINKQFADPVQNASTLEYLQSLWQLDLNVGPEQLARAVLYLEDGDMHMLEEIKESNFFGDPRDLIMRAVSKQGIGHSNYFLDPFNRQEWDYDILNLQ